MEPDSGAIIANDDEDEDDQTPNIVTLCPCFEESIVHAHTRAAGFLTLG